jgi:hypothetical protein
MGAGLLAGALLARAGRIRIHAACQSAIVLLNLALIVLTMFPVFHRQVLPKLPGRIGKPYYALAATHAALGGVAELAGLYIMLAAGTNLLPEKFRITRYKFCDVFSWLGGLFFSLEWPHMLVGTLPCDERLIHRPPRKRSTRLSGTGRVHPHQ